MASSDADDDVSIDSLYNASDAADMQLRNRAANHLAALFAPAPDEAPPILVTLTEDVNLGRATICVRSSNESYTGAVLDKDQNAALLEIAGALSRMNQNGQGK